MLFEYAQDEPDRVRTLVSSYIAAGGSGRIRDRGTFTMTIAQLGHIGERAFEIWLETGDEAERLRIEANMEEFLAQARLSVASIDLIIEAARTA